MGKKRQTASTLVDRLARFIQETSSSLPDDAEHALRKALRREAKGSSARMVLETILRNVELARAAGTPLCQDTGTLTFFVPERLRRRVTPSVLEKAVARASANGWLRRNTIDAVTGRSIDTNVCPGAPVVHYVLENDERRNVKGDSPSFATHTSSFTFHLSLLMKGGGSENMSRQFSLPDASIGAGRDLDETFGLIETAEKAAEIYMKIAHLPRLNTITDEQMHQLEKRFNIKAREGYLN